MKASWLPFLLVLAAGTLSPAFAAASIGEPVAVLFPTDEEIPAGIAAPKGLAGALLLTARGVQIYECRAVAGEANKYEWAFKAPEADLFDAQSNKGGRHFAGPTWELTDGGKVIGKLKAKADAPDGRGIPWLLLDVAEKSGPGVLGEAVSIQRVNTVGGQSPSEPADAAHAGQVRRVEYTATYLFYVAKP